MTELRCPSYKLHAVVLDNGLIEVQCRDKRCGYVPGTVILHRFDVDGNLKDTLKFSDPPRKGELINGSSSRNPAIRLP